MINTCTKFEFNPSTSWGSYARHRHNLLHGARYKIKDLEEQKIYNEILDTEIRKNEISDVIKHIKNGKATGYDNICI